MSARFTTCAVWAVWLAMLAGAIAYVALFGSRIPFQDDLSLVDVLALHPRDLLGYAWLQHNEHRIPLPRALQWAFYALTGDVRSGCYVSIALLASASALMIAAARSLRGRTSLADVVFPLLFLHTGNAENLLMGFQIALMLPTALVCAIAAIGIVRGNELSPRAALACAAALVALPLCGGPGMLQAPPLACWLAVLAWNLVRRGDARSRRAGAVLAIGVVATALVGLAYVVGLHVPASEARERAPLSMLDLSLRVLALALGPAAENAWPWSGAFVVASAISAAVVASHAAARNEEQRWRAAAVLVTLATSAVLALGIGFGRAGDGPNGFANRYVGLPIPLVCASFLAWISFGPRAVRPLVQGVLAIAMSAAVVLVNVESGAEYGRQRRDVSARIERDVAAGTSVRTLATRYAHDLDPEVPRLTRMLASMSERRLPPFDLYPDAARATAKWPMFVAAPREFVGALEPGRRNVEGQPVAMVPSGTRFVFDVPEGARRLVARYGALEGAWRSGNYALARLDVIAVDARGQPSTLVARVLEPASDEADRGAQELSLALQQPLPSRLSIGVSAGDANDARIAWLWLRDVAFE